MNKNLLTILVLMAMALLSCCSSVKSASLGAGSVAGRDYVTGLKPSAEARQYFTKIGNKAPIETLSRANATQSKSGVRFVAGDGILIPPGVTISFTNKGYCLDPKLPAPVADEEYQLVPTSALIPSKLQGIYRNLLRREASGDTTVKNNMQELIWALRTAGVEGDYASRLSVTQKSIMDSCSTRPGEFESAHNIGLTTNKLASGLSKIANSAVHAGIGGLRGKLSSNGASSNTANAQLNNLIAQGSKLPIQRTGFNYGELESGIYTDVRGTGSLAFQARIANNTNKDFIFYPSNYAGQVGSGSVLSALSDSSKNTQRQRVTMGPVDQLNVLDKREPQSCEPENNIPCVEENFDKVSLGMGIPPTTRCKIELKNGICQVRMWYEGKPILKINNNVIARASQDTKIDKNCLRNATLYHENKHIDDIIAYEEYAPAFIFPDAWVESLIKDIPEQNEKAITFIKEVYILYLESSYRIKIIVEKRAMYEEEKKMYSGWIVAKRKNNSDTPIEKPVSKYVNIKGKPYLDAWHEAMKDPSGYSNEKLEEELKKRKKILEIIGQVYLKAAGKTVCIY